MFCISSRKRRPNWYLHPFPTRKCTELVTDVFNHAERFFNFRKPSIPAFLCPDDILKLGEACDFDPSTIASTITSLLFDDVKLDGLLCAADCGSRRIVQRAAELYDSSNMEVRRDLVSEIKKIVWFRQETIKQMHELWDNRAALVFDTSHDAADDGLDDYCPFDIDLASLPRTPRPADRDPPLPTSMCEPAQRESAALTWTLRLRVADQYWRYVHDVKRTFETSYGHICVAVETHEHSDAFYAGRASAPKRTFIDRLSMPFVQRRRVKQRDELHRKLSSTNIPHVDFFKLAMGILHRKMSSIENNGSVIAEQTSSPTITTGDTSAECLTASISNGLNESLLLAWRNHRQNLAMAAMGVSKSTAIVPEAPSSRAFPYMADPNRQDPLEPLSSLTAVEEEYNATVDDHVHAVVLAEVLGLLGDYMTDICVAYEESEMLLAERLTSLDTRHIELGGSPLALPTSPFPEDARARVLSKASLKRAARTFCFQLPTLQTSAELAFSASPNVAMSTGTDSNTDSRPTDDSALIRFELPNATKLQLLLSAADDIVHGTLRRAYRLYDRLNKESKRQMSAYVNRLINVRRALEDRLRQLEGQRSASTLAVPMSGESSSATLGVTMGSAEAFSSSSLPEGHGRAASLERFSSNTPGEEGERPPSTPDAFEWILKLRLADEYWRFAQGVNEALEALYTHELGVSSKTHKRRGHGKSKSKRAKSAVSKAMSGKSTKHSTSKPSTKPTTSSKPAKHTTKRSFIGRLCLPFFPRKRRQGSLAL
ncbi:uncharacterized protein SCHCODRAFT_01111093 [Schizophyllum commune H4-8]|nr:uncharacterized protein SCHCODRAFT_01111093 [Schizophyllum commune H4-8]KAI5897224.1 hypothetical protein SCHCODRAFT_01111093 [Schizophyllum commune H4-8]